MLMILIIKMAQLVAGTQAFPRLVEASHCVAQAPEGLGKTSEFPRERSCVPVATW